MTPTTFAREMHKFDPYLRLRRSQDGAQWFIERRVRRESRCRVTPNERRKWDQFVRDRDGYMLVTAIPWDRLNREVFLALRAADMWQYRGAGPYADALEAAEREDELAQAKRDSAGLQDCGDEAFERMRSMEKDIEAGFHSKVGGMEFPGSLKGAAATVHG